jgi:hypothetical protein
MRSIVPMQTGGSVPVANLLSAVRVALSVALLAVAGAPAFAATAPSAFVQLLVNGQQVDSSLAVREDPANPKLRVFEGGSSLADAYQLSFSGVFDPDPFIAWSLQVSNFTNSPLAITVTFGIAVAGGPYDQVRNFFSGELEDLRGDGVSATGLQNRALLDAVAVPGSFIGADCVYGASSPNAIGACPPAPATQYGEAVTAVPSALYAILATQTAFTVSAYDIARFEGTTTLDVAEVPEPATLVLLLAGLALLVGMRRLS